MQQPRPRPRQHQLDRRSLLIIGGIRRGDPSLLEPPAHAQAWGSALLGTVLWPLILLGVNLHIH